MDTINETGMKITIGDAELWTRPFGDELALIMANEAGVKRFLYETYKKHPEYFDLLAEDLCEEDLDGTFSLIVDPCVVQMLIMPGCGRFGFRIDQAVEDDDDE